MAPLDDSPNVDNGAPGAEPAAVYVRQPGEPARAYLAFCVYRDAGQKRSLLEAARKFYGEANGHQSIRRIERWSSEWNWVVRVRAWDDQLDRDAREGQREEARQMAVRHTKLAMAVLAKAASRLEALDVDALAPKDLIRFVTEGAKLERLSRGEPDTIAENRVSVTAETIAPDFAEMLLKKLAAARDQMAARHIPAERNGHTGP